MYCQRVQYHLFLKLHLFKTSRTHDRTSTKSPLMSKSIKNTQTEIALQMLRPQTEREHIVLKQKTRLTSR